MAPEWRRTFTDILDNVGLIPGRTLQHHVERFLLQQHILDLRHMVLELKQTGKESNVQAQENSASTQRTMNLRTHNTGMLLEVTVRHR